ncbi:MAG: riboflavin biosynthesis protein RibF [Elusimicrobiota bacterium]|jgi:riboflavin kinase/FMN adenylyltransferase|nr:riboflavin biosynthesis protein RibF [Elusimicrobiota bacterium]
MRKNFITIGAFDGVHLGHRRLIYALKDFAAQNKMNSAVLAFGYPPKVVMQGLPPQAVITTPAEKFELIRALGPAQIYKLDFNKLRDLSARDFFAALLKKYKMGGILVGPDFAFGKDRGGRLDFLKKACAANNIIYIASDFVQEGGRKISSSLIRAALRGGDIESVGKMLGRPYRLSGKIVKGRRLGRAIGFPTANMAVDGHKILPPGVFAVRVYLGKEVFKGVCNIGTRPTIDKNGAPSVETHILDFNRSIYGRVLKVDFLFKIRGEKKFSGLDELKIQIAKDARAARKNIFL